MVAPVVFAMSNENGPSSPQMTRKGGFVVADTITWAGTEDIPNMQKITRKNSSVFLITVEPLKVQKYNSIH